MVLKRSVSRLVLICGQKRDMNTSKILRGKSFIILEMGKVKTYISFEIIDLYTGGQDFKI